MFWSGHFTADEAERLADEPVALEQPGLPPRLLAYGRFGQSQRHWYARSYAEAARDIEIGLAHARAAGADRIIAIATGTRAMAHDSLGEVDQGVRLMRDSVARERRRYG